MEKVIKLDEYQEIAMGTLYQFRSKEKQLEYAVIGLCGEAGELANILKKMIFYREIPTSKANIINELSDVLWYIACVADSLNMKLSDVATFSKKKIIAKRLANKNGDLYKYRDWDEPK